MSKDILKCDGMQLENGNKNVKMKNKEI